MKNLCQAAFWLLLIIPFSTRAQSFNKVAGQAFLVYRMAEKFHVEPRPLDDNFSRDLWTTILKVADEDELFFSDNDIARLRTFELSLDDEIKARKTSFISLFATRFTMRLKQADSLTGVICASRNKTVAASGKTGTGNKTATPAKNTTATPPASDLDELKSRLQAYIEEKESCTPLRRQINYLLRNAAGSTEVIGNLYCQAIAECFDPHTGYFSLAAKESFETHLGKQPFKFGLRVKEEKEALVVEDLQPGTPAFKSGQLQKGDTIIQAQWSGNKAAVVTPSDKEEFSDLLSMSNHDTLLLSVRKSNGTVVKVPLLKEQVHDNNENANRVKSFLLKGTQNAGYIYLPCFYEDWDRGNMGIMGCANDVAREIVKLKKENINGLILDLRFNGGGSVQEAMELAGIFIDAGPVAQMKTREPKPHMLYDVNRGTAFDGPLVVLVNSYSASASELVAATLQDYNRAVIVGSPTYGKATGQTILPLDTTIVPGEKLPPYSGDGFIKLTVSKMYRVNGTSLQATGVIPSVIVSDSLLNVQREADAPFALKANAIDANKYYKPYPQLPPVNAQPTNAVFTITNHEAEKQSLQTDAYSNQLNEAFKMLISQDNGVKTAYDILLKLNKK